MIEGLPQIVVPELAYNVLLCSLFTAFGWHLVNIVGSLRKRRQDS
jgi:hypothetical protein